jgi:hypothetical protein
VCVYRVRVCCGDMPGGAWDSKLTGTGL